MSTEVVASQWRNVEIGRVVLLTDGPSAGKLGAVVEIIDHKRVLIDSPTVERQAIALKHVTLTPHVLAKLPRGAGSGVVKKTWEKSDVDKKWSESAWAKKRVTREKRRTLNDFERFKVMVLKKQRRYEVRKAIAKLAKA